MKKTIGLLLSTGLLASVAMGACIDVTPDDFSPHRPAVMGSAGGSSQHPLGTGFSAECLRCLNAPDAPGFGCNTEWLKCKDAPLCTFVLQCATDIGCLRAPTRGQQTNCALACETHLSVTDPGLPALIAMDLCIANSCQVCTVYAQKQH